MMQKMNALLKGPSGCRVYIATTGFKTATIVFVSLSLIKQPENSNLGFLNFGAVGGWVSGVTRPTAPGALQSSASRICSPKDRPL